jgi:hypothetical protein
MIDPNDLVGKFRCKILKEEAYFIYFTLEAHEGLCSFSTIPHEKGQAFRMLEINYSLSLKAQVEHLIRQLKRNHYIEILEDIVSENV